MTQVELEVLQYYGINKLKAKPYYIHAAQVFTESSIKQDCFVLIEASLIREITTQPKKNITVVELGELNLLPGFLDLHIHGREGADIMDATPEAIETISTSLAKHGVIGFLGEVKGGAPVPLRRAEVNRMLGKVDELSVENENVAIPFIIGETVKVVDGPFNGFDGTVEKVNEEKRKLEVMVKIFGRKTPLELSYTQVDKIS